MTGNDLTGNDLTVRGLVVRYGKASAVNHVDLDVPAGRVTALVGPNGAGKSSTLLGIYGSITAHGSVTVGGRELTSMSAARRARAGISLVPQGRQLFPKMSVAENLRLYADLLALPPSAALSAMDRFPILHDRRAQMAGVLSGGEQQMLVVARALMAEPSVVLLDEMTTGLAPKIVSELTDAVAELARGGAAVLLAAPAIAATMRIIDRGYVLVRGEVVDAAESGEQLDRAYQRAMGLIQDEVQAESV
ncbi:ATP-binding cassette domain-containing protein [Nocardioides sp. zg-ZUI104]|uniref:ABC transporter ATP-binding protein n=1 Tax=Nocardioides faecalis TaxID=2803858 RepID=UPI001BD1BC9D|nr:ATP-binding cassette domain-containing protein [Nocardioides faecalis]MBS4751940.1 ATP-binding cassette domain-containing protein [Nocardioides faecalis]